VRIIFSEFKHIQYYHTIVLWSILNPLSLTSMVSFLSLLFEELLTRTPGCVVLVGRALLSYAFL
jgi:hypothetical protein